MVTYVFENLEGVITPGLAPLTSVVDQAKERCGVVLRGSKQKSKPSIRGFVNDTTGVERPRGERVEVKHFTHSPV